MLHTGLLSRACSACFVTEPRTKSLGVTVYIVSYALLHQPWIKKRYRSLAHRAIWWWQLLNWGSLFQNDCNLCPVDIKLSSKQKRFIFHSLKIEQLKTKAPTDSVFPGLQKAVVLLHLHRRDKKELQDSRSKESMLSMWVLSSRVKRSLMIPHIGDYISTYALRDKEIFKVSFTTFLKRQSIYLSVDSNKRCLCSFIMTL